MGQLIARLIVVVGGLTLVAFFIWAAFQEPKLLGIYAFAAALAWGVGHASDA